MKLFKVGSIAVLAACMVVMAGCVRRPRHVMSDKEMAGIVADMELAEAYLNSGQQDIGSREEMRECMVEGVLKRHKVSREDFDSTLSWYGHNVDAYYKLDAEINRALAARQKQLAKKSGSMKEVDVQLDDIWPYRRTAVIWEKSGSNVLRFSVPVAEAEKGTQMKWKMRTRTPSDMGVVMGVEYADGTVSYVSRSVNSQKNIEVICQTDTGMKLKRVFGYLNARKPQELPIYLDSIQLVKEPYDSTLYYRVNSQRRLSKPSRPAPKPVKPDTIN